jgi:protein SCO1/2
MNHKRPELALALLLVSIGVLGGLAAARFSPQPPQAHGVEWLAPSRLVEDFTLESADGAFTREDLLGQWHLLLIGYTHCPDICPTSLSEINALEQAMPAGIRIPVIFVSVDAARDAPDQLARYLAFFNPDFIGATGKPHQLQPLTDALGIRYQISGSQSQPEIAHSVTISLIDPDGGLRGRLRPGFNAEATAAEITRVMRGRARG